MSWRNACRFPVDRCELEGKVNGERLESLASASSSFRFPSRTSSPSSATRSPFNCHVVLAPGSHLSRHGVLYNATSSL